MIMIDLRLNNTEKLNLHHKQNIISNSLGNGCKFQLLVLCIPEFLTQALQSN